MTLRVLLLSLACAPSAEVAPPPAPPAATVPTGWGAAVVPAADAFREAPRTCRLGTGQWTFEGGGRFTVTTPKAKSMGDWKQVGADVVFLSNGPMLDRVSCSSARWLPLREGAVLLCAEGPFSCGTEARWAVEIVDAGAGPDAARAAAKEVAPPPAVGPGVVFGTNAPPSAGSSVRYRTPGDRRLGEAVAASLALAATEDPEAPSPVVVTLGTP
jgi:hypothetical protein